MGKVTLKGLLAHKLRLALTAVAIGLCLAVTVVFGVWPAPLLDFCRQATLLFIGQ